MNSLYPSIFCSLAGLTMAQVPHAAPLTLAVGQVIQLAPNGTAPALSLTHVGNTGRTVYTAGASFDGVDVYTIGGMMGYTTAWRVEISGGPLDHVDYLSIYEPQEDFDYLTQVRITTAGKALVLDSSTGRFTEFSGYSGGTFKAARVSGTQTGGTFSIRNVRVSISEKLVYADIRGQSAPVGTRPAATYAEDNVPLWTIDTLSGPGSLPIAALQVGGDVGARLTGAGFRILSVTPTRITFSGLYKLKNLRMTEQGLNLWDKSLGSLSLAKNTIRSANSGPQGLGELQVSTMLSIPIPPK